MMRSLFRMLVMLLAIHVLQTTDLLQAQESCTVRLYCSGRCRYEPCEMWPCPRQAYQWYQCCTGGTCGPVWPSGRLPYCCS